MDSLLIDCTLQEIAREYKTGLLAWLKRQPDQWKRLLSLEGTINAAALANDQKELAGALSAYRSFFSEVMEDYEKEKALP